MKKALRTCYLQRVRPAQHKPVGRVWGILERNGVMR
uniref:Rrp44-like cold shock domain n=1 Tax=Ackermannviridae sp. TaxID=2831612 RepID=A0A8S5VJ29_9CAUD|nr:MAG TPA: Rrp44-like cold shock domain [Ackermannviridae sp.]